MYRIPAYKVTLVREGSVRMATRPSIRSSFAVADLFREYIGSVDRECFVVAMLDTKNKIIGVHTVSMGSLTASLVHPREAYKPAIVANASAVVFAHNHPSGDPQPSREDSELTERLTQAGRILGIRMLDHVIVGDGTDRHYSFADEGALPALASKGF